MDADQSTRAVQAAKDGIVPDSWFVDAYQVTRAVQAAKDGIVPDSWFVCPDQVTRAVQAAKDGIVPDSWFAYARQFTNFDNFEKLGIEAKQLSVLTSNVVTFVQSAQLNFTFFIPAIAYVWLSPVVCASVGVPSPQSTVIVLPAHDGSNVAGVTEMV